MPEIESPERRTGLVRIIAYLARQRRELTDIAERSEARFSHTSCPDCGRTRYGDLAS
jgi:hypothetical protein